MKQVVGWTIYFVSLAVMVLVLFFYLTKVRGADDGGAVQYLIQLDLRNDYPASPKELADLCTLYVQCLYNDTYTDDEFVKLAFQLYKLFGPSFYTDFPGDTYIAVLKDCIESQRINGRTMSAYVLFGGSSVSYYYRDEIECAHVDGTVTFREGQNIYSADTKFDIRKDEEGNWGLWYWHMMDSGTNRFPLVAYNKTNNP
jgi:hypothetical protein